MGSIILRFIGCISAALLAFSMSGCQTAKNGQRVTPGPTGSVYTSPLGNFTCKVPALLRPGAYQVGQSDADWAAVHFDDDFGRLVRIESARIPPEATAKFEPPNTISTLDEDFDGRIYPRMFRSVSPSSEVLYRERITTAAGQTLFAVVSIPEGSSLVSSDGAGQSRRLDSVRGVMLFSKSGFMYIVMNQEWPGGTNLDHGAFADRIKRLQDDLQEIVSGMSFK